MKIRQPQFDLNQEVIAHFNEIDQLTTIAARFYDPDKGQWFYQVAIRNFSNPLTIDNLSKR